MDQRKLQINELVEVRQFEEGLRGSWHLAQVIAVSNLYRTVQYAELLDERGVHKLIESIPVTEAIEGRHKRRHLSLNYRGRIRPISGTLPIDTKLGFGCCVDAFFQDAWWEGVIIDANEDAPERSVYFPDEGDVVKFGLDNLRVSRVWDEFSGEWMDSGVWVLLELVRELDGCNPSSKYIKMLWRRLQSNYEFNKMISEWNCGSRSLWKKYLKDAVCERERKSMAKDLAYNKVMAHKTRNGRLRLGNPEQVEVRVDAHSPETFDESKTSKDSSSVELTGNGRVSFLNKSRTRMVAVPLRLNVTKPNQPVVPTTGDGNVLSETLSLEENFTSYVNSVQSDVNPEEKCSKTRPASCGSTDKVVSCTQLRRREEQFGKAEDKEENLKVIQEFNDNAERMKHQLSEDNIAECASCAGKNQSAGRAGVKKWKQTRSKFVVLSSENKQKEPSGKASIGVAAKRKISYARRKRLKKVCRGDENTEPQSKHEDMDDAQVKDNLFFSQRRRSSLFDRFGKNFKLKDMVSRPQKRKKKRQPNGPESDTICFVCHYGTDLVSCNSCFSAFHLTCLKHELVPDENWVCPSCCCGRCGLSVSINDKSDWRKICSQCSRRYHLDCLNKMDHGVSSCANQGFCSSTCYQLYLRLHQLLGSSNTTSVDGLTWTIIRSVQSDYRMPGLTRKANVVKLSQALKVIHESFQPITELHTKRDMVKDIVYSSRSKLQRLNFEGFYVMALQKGDEVVSAATIRIHGRKVAEMPLIATNFDYRRQGMCHLLVHELITLLAEMGIERFILPAASEVKSMWEKSFGFTEMRPQDRIELLGYPLLAFQGTTMIQKFVGGK